LDILYKKKRNDLKKIFFGLIACGLFSTFESFSKDYDSGNVAILNNQRNLTEILNQYEAIVEEAKDNVRKFEKEAEEDRDFSYLLKESDRLRKDIERRIDILKNLKNNAEKLNIQKKISNLKDLRIDDLKINLSDLEKRLQNEQQNAYQPNQKNKKDQKIKESLTLNWKEIHSFQKDLKAFFIVLQKREAKLNTILRLGHKLFDDTKKRNLFISEQDSPDEAKRLSYLIYQSRYPEALRVWNNDVKNIRGEKGFEPIQNMKDENKNKLNKFLKKIQYLHQDVLNLTKLNPKKKK
jgi:hypothetical protein